ncbi:MULTISPECIES: ABC transporter ATP-binding protein [Enterococcus]|uniref:ABC transporter ATP-binding protein n=1 Tax=Enterococcus TaxID=1350 RepID=UPI0010F91857|nr:MULTISPECIES: ABC transporter ATP-binding protein [Enterococcus]KAF1301138.1 hypothetical protein BAU16_10385 [Enterococcus sp. JM9B]
MISVKNITVSFEQVTVLKNLTFQIYPREIIGLVAPNGTGKSTLLNVLMNYLSPTSGKVFFDDLTYQNKQTERKIHEQITMMPDQSDLYDSLSGSDHLKIYQKMWSKTAIDYLKVIDDLHMENYVKRKVGEYSLGMRQRLCFAMQIVANTPYMLMDEVMNGLDPTNVTLLSQLLIQKREEGKTIIISSHLLENLEQYSDRIFFLKDGNFIKEIKKNEDNEPVVKFKFTLKKTTTINGKQVTTLPNGTSYIPFVKNTDDIASIFQQLQVLGVEEMAITAIDLKDLYSFYFETNA